MNRIFHGTMSSKFRFDVHIAENALLKRQLLSMRPKDPSVKRNRRQKSERDRFQRISNWTAAR